MKILVAIHKPTTDKHATIERWHKDMQSCEVQAVQKGVSGNTKLGEGCWQIHEESGLPLLAILFSQADNAGYAYEVQFDGDAAVWKYVPPQIV